MNFSLPIKERPKVAIVGAGISGLASAYQLADEFEVTVFEAQNRLGGHARTITSGHDGAQPVDTGFIVFNYVNYPHLTRMFQALEVPVEKSNMSFGISVDDGKIEYALRDLGGIFAQRRNFFRPGMYRMIRDILHFANHVQDKPIDDALSVGELLDQIGVGDWFTQYYLLPICGAIWSTPTKKIRDFPAKSLVQFFQNHGLLKPKEQHQWWTVSGGSISYVRRLRAHLEKLGVNIRTNAPVTSIQRSSKNASVKCASHEFESFDAIILACHSDEALRLLNKPRDEERQALSNIRYQDNRTILHTDETQMPKTRACWSSWVYQSSGQGEDPALAVTYWMNSLQNISSRDPYFVTLNPLRDIPDHKIYDETNFRHPIFDLDALKAQKQIRAFQGKDNTWYAGAYLRHGFHEDGFASAVRAARGVKAKFRAEVLL